MLLLHVVRPGPWSVFVYVLIIVLISYFHMYTSYEELPEGARISLYVYLSLQSS
jgi:hypothetical protein